MATSNNNRRPFDDISAQNSSLILEIISSVKTPLLRIYDIGVESGCSHYKHLARLAEYVLLAPAGEPMNFPFDEEKINKTKRNLLECGLTDKQKAEVAEIGNAIIDLLGAYGGVEATKHEQFVFHFLLRLLQSFSGTTEEIEEFGGVCQDFHDEKQVLFDAYNTFIIHSQTIQLPTTREEKDKLLRKANMQVLSAEN